MVIVFLRVCRRSHLWNDNALMDPMVVKQSSFIPKKPSALLLYSCADRHGHYSLISQSYLLLLQQKGRKFGRNSPIIKGECQPPSGGPQIKERGSPIPQMVNMKSSSWHCKKKVLSIFFGGYSEMCVAQLS